MVGQLQRGALPTGAVTSSAGASEEALAPSNPTIYVDTMQPHILKGYNATVHDPQCGVDASCQEGNPPSPELTFLSGGFNARKRPQLYQSMGGVLHQKMVLCIEFIEWIDCSLVHPCSVSIQRRRGAQHNLDPTAARVDPLTSGCAIF